MSRILPWLVLVAVLAFALIRIRQRRGEPSALPAWPAGWRGRTGKAGSPFRPGRLPLLDTAVVLVAAREIRERVRGRVFRAGTLLILAVVAAVIVIPALISGKPHTQRVGVVGGLSSSARAAITAAGRDAGTAVHLVPQADLEAARGGLRSGRLDVVIVGAREVMVNEAIGSTGTSATARLAQAVAATLGADRAFAAAGLTAGQAAQLAHAKPLPVTSLRPAPATGTTRTLMVGLILLVVMLSQYNTWTLIGVMEEKSSRIAEVLLATVRPFELLAGKLLGIGLVAFAQAALIVAVAIGLARAVGSDLLRGTAPVELAVSLAWLLLGYAFYSWVYAAAGSLGERRDQVQGLILPLSLPIFAGYAVAETAIASGSPSTLVVVLAYLPPTAPFAMPVLVGLGAVTWWEFAASAALTIACTAGVARLATGIYRRAILRTGRRVPVREVLRGPARPPNRPLRAR